MEPKELSARAVRAARLGAARARWELKQPLRNKGFPYTAPTLPRGVEPLPEEPDLGIHYDTEWARSYPVRLARAAAIETVGRPFVAAMARPTLKGLDRLDGLDEAVVFASNHISHADTGAIVASLPVRWRHNTVVAGAADYFFDRKWKAHAMAFLFNAIPIERHKISVRSATLPTDLLKDGWSVLIYPEGGRSPDGWPQHHKPGAAFVAKRAGAPVVPLHVAGTRLIMAPNKGGIRPGKVTITFGSPLRIEAGEDVREFGVRVERAVATLAVESSTDWWTAKRAAAADLLPVVGPEAVPWRRNWAMSARVKARKDKSNPKRDWPNL